MGRSGGAMVLGKLSVPGCPTILDNSEARAYCACSRCGRSGLDIFSLIDHFSFLSPSLWETTRYRLKYCLKGPLNPIIIIIIIIYLDIPLYNGATSVGVTGLHLGNVHTYIYTS